MFRIRTVDDEVFETYSYSFEDEGKRLDGTSVVQLIEFVPQNGPDRGCLVKLPVARLKSVAEREPALTAT